MSFDPSTVASFADTVTSAGFGLGSKVFAKKEADKQYRRNRRMYKSRYQWQMADMRKAGLNPILAAGATPPTTSTGAASDSSQPNIDMAGKINQSRVSKSTANMQNASAKLISEQQKTEQYKQKQLAADAKLKSNMASTTEPLASAIEGSGLSAGIKSVAGEFAKGLKGDNNIFYDSFMKAVKKASTMGAAGEAYLRNVMKQIEQQKKVRIKTKSKGKH